MAYSSKAELDSAITVQTVIDLTDDELSGSANTARISKAIEWSDQQIDGHCQAHFLVPFTTTPAIIANISLTLAIWYLYRRRRQAFGVPEDIQDAKDSAMKQLQRINEGKLDLGQTPIPAASSKMVATSSGPDQLFTYDTLKKMG